MSFYYKFNEIKVAIIINNNDNIISRMEKKRIDTKTIVLAGLLTALTILLQFLSTIIPTGVNLNLALVPITLGAVLLGPYVGAFLGLVCGAVILLSPNTVTVFMAISPVGTILACLLKTTIAGLLAGFVAKAFKEKNDLLSAVLASIIVPLVNTLIFAIIAYFFFLEGLGLSDFWSIFTVLIGLNFLFEIVTNVIISPTTYKVINQIKRN